MPWHEQRETIEMLYVHNHLNHLFDDEDPTADDMGDMASAGFTVRRDGAEIS